MFVRKRHNTHFSLFSFWEIDFKLAFISGLFYFLKNQLKFGILFIIRTGYRHIQQAQVKSIFTHPTNNTGARPAASG